MEMALYEPGLGYYSAGATKLGRDGDFVTAPEISPLFSRCLANQCAEVLHDAAGGRASSSSARARASWRPTSSSELDAQERLPARYCILEVSADLRERQRRRCCRSACPALAGARRMAGRLARRLSRRRARERSARCDARPALSHPRHAGQCGRRDLAARPARLVRSARRAALEAAVRAIETQLGEPLPDGYASEVNLRLHALDREARGCAAAKASRCSSTTDCRARSTTAASAAKARCCVTSVIASTTIR